MKLSELRVRYHFQLRRQVVALASELRSERVTPTRRDNLCMHFVEKVQALREHGKYTIPDPVSRFQVTDVDRSLDRFTANITLSHPQRPRDHWPPRSRQALT